MAAPSTQVDATTWNATSDATSIVLSDADFSNVQVLKDVAQALRDVAAAIRGLNR